MQIEKEYLSTKEVAALFGISAFTFSMRRAEMEREGFPMPLPWNRRKRLYHRRAVEAWKARQEQAAKCLPLPDYAKPFTLVREAAP